MAEHLSPGETYLQVGVVHPTTPGFDPSASASSDLPPSTTGCLLHVLAPSHSSTTTIKLMLTPPLISYYSRRRAWCVA